MGLRRSLDYKPDLAAILAMEIEINTKILSCRADGLLCDRLQSEIRVAGEIRHFFGTGVVD